MQFVDTTSAICMGANINKKSPIPKQCYVKRQGLILNICSVYEVTEIIFRLHVIEFFLSFICQ